ncbi:MAG: hypothetical protein ACOYO0_03865 [Sandarakinorhabdus sp.]|jgi:hypothetical protein
MRNLADHALQGASLRCAEPPAKAPPMDADTTWTLLAAGLLMAGVGAIGGVARARAPLAWHAHIPWNGLAFGGVACALVAAAHLFTLLKAA